MIYTWDRVVKHLGLMNLNEMRDCFMYLSVVVVFCCCCCCCCCFFFCLFFFLSVLMSSPHLFEWKDPVKMF